MLVKSRLYERDVPSLVRRLIPEGVKLRFDRTGCLVRLAEPIVKLQCGLGDCCAQSREVVDEVRTIIDVVVASEAGIALLNGFREHLLLVKEDIYNCGAGVPKDMADPTEVIIQCATSNIDQDKLDVAALDIGDELAETREVLHVLKRVLARYIDIHIRLRSAPEPLVFGFGLQ